jgi:hypothetical protein
VEPGPRGKSQARAARQTPDVTYADIDRFVRIAKADAERRLRLKQAILNGDSKLEHALAREVCGLPPEPED